MTERFGVPYNDFSAFPATDVNVARICRTWCVIGYNHQEFIPGLLDTFKTLKNTGCRSPSLYGMFISASTLDELLPLIVRTQFSPDQHLVRLYEREIGVQDVGQIPGITTLPYLRTEADGLFDRLVGLLAVQKKSPSASGGVVKLSAQEVSSNPPTAHDDSASYPTLQEAQKMGIRKHRIPSKLPVAKSSLAAPQTTQGTMEAPQAKVLSKCPEAEGGSTPQPASQGTGDVAPNGESSKLAVTPSDPASAHPTTFKTAQGAVEAPKVQVSPIPKWRRVAQLLRGMTQPVPRLSAQRGSKSKDA